MEAMMEVAAVLAGANVMVVMGLIYFYGRIALRSGAVYAVGLVIFALLLLSHDLLTVFAYVTMSPLFGAEAMPFLVGISGLELAGLLVLLKMTV
jgi:hypothetical protein